MIVPDLLLAYFISGFLFALWFIVFKLKKIIGGQKAGFWFRLFIMPGIILLWPWVLGRISRTIKPD